MAIAVEMQNITKRFPGVLANDNISLVVGTGEIHGLIGENGAGKSTLMNILYGLYHPDEGKISLFGEEKTIDSPHAAIGLGIGMVHQHFMLMPNLTVLQNIILGSTPKKAVFIDVKTAKKKITQIMDQYELQVDLDSKIFQLSVGQKQRVEIVKSLYRGAKVLIMDEPTAVLTPQETDRLLETLRKLKDQGCAIIFITHKLREVLAITDKITVMRKGVVTGKVDTCDATPNQLSTMMVGREVNLNIDREKFLPGEVVLRVNDLHALNVRGLPALRGISFDVRAGEIVGIAGVEGNGQTELVEAITGMIPLEKGTVEFDNKQIQKLAVRKRREMGMSHIPEDRLKVGTSKTCSIRENMVLNKYYKPPFSKYGVLNIKKLKEFSLDLCKRFSVKTPNTENVLGTLSGGNMQKVVLAREIEFSPRLLIAAQPTRGVDIGSIEYIHQKIVELRDMKKAVLLVSAELDEVMSLADRILVVYEGQIVGEFSRDEINEGEIGLYMAGAKASKKGVSAK